MENQTFWEEKIYSKGKHLNRYPFDSVVSFIYRWHCRDRAREEINILEIGCGAGNNLWFAAREGFNVSGIDISHSAIEYAKERLLNDELAADLQVGCFNKLPWEDSSQDLGIDHCATACVDFNEKLQAIEEMHRVLKSGGLFFLNGYSDQHTSYQGSVEKKDLFVTDIQEGTLMGINSIGFLTQEQIIKLFSKGWEIKNLEHIEYKQSLPREGEIHAEWRIVAQKI